MMDEQTIEELQNLLYAVNKGWIPVAPDQAVDALYVTYHLPTGHVLVAFNDAGDWDYFERIVMPDGRQFDFDDIPAVLQDFEPSHHWHWGESEFDRALADSSASSAGALPEAQQRALGALAKLRPCKHAEKLCECGYFFSEDGEAYVLKVLSLGDNVDPVLNRERRMGLIATLAAVALGGE